MSSKSILVIEDEENVRNNIVTLLDEEGYTVYAAANGREGIAIAKKELPSLIICDILMPEMDGYTVLKELSKDPKTRTIPFVYLTARVERDDLRKGMQLGADDYLFKPFKTSDLLDAVSVRLSKREILIASGIVNRDKKKKTKERLSTDDKMFLNVNGKPFLLRVNEIVHISAENQYTSIKLVDGKSILIRKSINHWEESLPSKKFIRIHRSTIINSDLIAKMERWYNSSFLIYLKDVKEPFVISKRYSTKMRQNQI